MNVPFVSRTVHFENSLTIQTVHRVVGPFFTPRHQRLDQGVFNTGVIAGRDGDLKPIIHRTQLPNPSSFSRSPGFIGAHVRVFERRCVTQYFVVEYQRDLGCVTPALGSV
jgi:hypothetical protein